MNNKTIKKYVDGKWVTLTNPDITVIQEIESGKVSDTNVIVTNYNYTEDGEETTLDNTLSTISNDISKLQRNVSWLAEHGGGGGSGSGGTFNPYGFEIDTPHVENGGSIFLKKEEMASITVKFRITGGYDGDVCRYQYVYDGGQPSALKDLEINKYETIVFDNSQSTAKSHFLKISGLNPYGTNISPFSFNIYLSNLSIKFVGELSSDIFYISQNDTIGELPLVIENGIIGSETVVSGVCTQGRPTYYPPFTNKTTDPQRIALNFWEMVDRDQTSPGEDYIVTFSAFAKLGATELTDTTVPLRVRVINPSELTVVIGAEGSGGETQIDVQQNSLLNYNFNVFAPANLGRYVYYSAIIEKANGQKKLILGEYYDEDAHNEGANIQNNPMISINTIKTEAYRLADSLYGINEVVELKVKVFASSDTSIYAIAWKKIKIIAESRSFWKRQYYNRIGTQVNPDTLFACWDKNNITAASKFKWTSNITNYSTISYTTQTPITISVDILNANNASGAQTSEGTPFFRLQNHAYGKIDFSNYASELQTFFSDRQTFTVSVTLVDNNQTGTDHTLFLWGSNNQDGELTGNGFRIDTNKIYWAYKEDISGQITQKSLSCNIPRGQKTTIDFVYEGDKLKIYKNGILNMLKRISKIDSSSMLPNIAYFGVNCNASQNLNNYADVDIYEFAIYTKSLNDIQIAINGKNARIEGSDEESITDYNGWLTKNFISSPGSSEVPESEFFKGNGFNEYFSTDSLTNIKAISKIPTIVLNFGVDTKFTEDFFYNSYTSGDITKDLQTCTGTYYDPNKRTDISLNLKAALQGTSTLMYRVKNLELIMNEYVEIEGVTETVLFQPKNIWMPEKQFTLKADVVDSAHANNAVIGEWINTNASQIGLVDNPAMEQFAQEENKPLYVDLNGTPVPHYSTKQQKNIDYHEDVTIKHTLEGFPVLLFIKFKDVSPEHASTPFKFIGIYSFNLGRYSYYNMGMKFLESFSRLDSNGNDEGCPAIIRYYKEKTTLGTISANDVYSFEFDNDANENNHDLPMWSQSNSSITYSLGEFKYPENVSESDPIWNGGLKNLFEQTSKWFINGYYNDSPPTYINASGETQNIFDPIYPYHVEGTGSDKRYVKDSDNPITQDNYGYEYLSEALNISTAARYFMIANAFGMTDSLGKNMTIRSWNGGRTWYTCFYDMDTALGLANDGSESILTTASIDKLKTTVDTETQTTKIQTTYHDDSSQYAQHISKLWGILRDRMLLYNMGQTVPLYETIWQTMRSGDGALSSSDKFVNVMRERVETCGELIFDCDYNSKYVQQGQGAGSDASQFLHGTRVDYVRDWLKRHFYYLDGLFDITRYGLTGTYEDSPYYGEEFMASVNYPLVNQRLAFNVRATTPSFLKISVGNAESAKFFVEKENTDMTVYIANSTSPNSQIAIKGSSLLSKLDGLQNAFQDIRPQNQQGAVKSLSVFNVSDSKMLNAEPVLTTTVFFNENNSSSLETLNLSGTKLIDETAAYEVNLINFNKLLNIDISNSDVKTIVFPNTALETLRFNNSKITTFTLNDQPKITNISFDDCNKLQTITIGKCDAITSLVIDSKPLLTSISIQNCNSIKSIDIIDCTALQTINIYNLPSLERLTVRSDFGAGAVNTTIYNCGNLSSLTLNNIYSAQTVTIDSVSAASVKYLNLDGFFYFSGFKFNGNPVETYGGDFVVDLTPFTSLRGENFSANNVLKVHYIRVKNINDPFKIPQNFTRSSKTVLTRIFGHFSIYGPDQFLECNQFYIREPLEQIGGETPFDDEYYVWEEGSGATNVTIATNDLTNVFRSTNCSLSDVYYIFKQSRHNISAVDVEIMQGTFFGCKNVITTMEDQLNRNLFSGLTELYNIDELFNGADIGGYLEAAILTPLSTNLENFVTVFGSNEFGTNKYYVVDQGCFFPEGNKIKNVVGFNPIPYNVEAQQPYYVFDNELLKNLTEVELIDNSFNDCYIDFTTGEYENCDLFKLTTKLKKIRRSFLRVVGWGSLRNIFGGNSSSENEFPQNLESVVNSFSFREYDDEGQRSDHESGYCPIKSDIDSDPETHFGVMMPIGNSFFKKIKSSIKNIGGRDNSNYSEKCFYSEEIGGQPGNGLRKYLDLGDCDGETFCYKIFDGCENLEEIPYFFEGLDFGVTGLTASTVPILFDSNGQSMFSGLTKLWNINGLFANMKNAFYTLSGNAFEDCAIVTAAYAFKEGDSSNDATNAKRIGAIPYKLFYQGDVENTISGDNFGISKQTAADMGILADFEEYIANSGDPSEYYYIEVDSAEKFKLNFTYNTPKCLIANLSHVFENSNSSAVSAYTSTSIIFDEWIEDNEKYNPIMFYVTETVSGFVYTYNEEYVPYKKKWNKFIFDGTSDFIYRITASTEYQKLINGDPEFIDEYGNPILDKDMPELWDYVVEDFLSDLSKYDTGIDRISSSDPIYQELFGLQNYFCPQDIFRYCANERDTLIDAAFNNGSPSIVTIGTNTWRCGLKGRIAPYIFEPITKILSMSNVFSKCRGILPHRWATIENGVTKLGTIYPPTLFSGLTLMTTCTSMFSEGSVWGRTVVPQALFSTNTQLVNISSMWSQTTWIENTIKTDAPSGLTEQFPVGVFANNVKLANISNLFAWGGPFIMSTNLLTLANNPSLSNTAGFLYRGNNLQDTSRVPTFWTGWNKIKSYENTFFGISQAIIFAQDIPEDWWIER